MEEVSLYLLQNQLPPHDEPFVLLMGLERGWQVAAARHLEPIFPHVVLTTDVPMGSRAACATYLAVLRTVAPAAKIIAAWVGPTDWEWIEWGGMLDWPNFLLGMRPDAPWDHAGHLRHAYEALGLRCFESMDDLVDAVKHAR